MVANVLVGTTASFLAIITLDLAYYLLASAFVELNPKAVFLAAGTLLVLTALLGATSGTTRTAD